jgi:hypothetical protein
VLGANTIGKIAGDYGTGTHTTGFEAIAPYGPQNLHNENHPGGTQTEITSLSDAKSIAGWYRDKHGWIFGCMLWTGIRGKGYIGGYMTNAAGDTVCWLLKGGHFTIFRYPNSDYTVPWSVNSQDDIVGQYQDQQNKTHGFILSPPLASQRWQQIDEPNAKGPMAVHSVNDHHTMVGFYADASHHVDGFLATPKK